MLSRQLERVLKRVSHRFVLLAMVPGTVDLSCLPPKGQKRIGVEGKMAPQDASAEFGRETLAAAAQVVIKEVTHRLENRQVYHGHGRSLLEGLWKNDKDKGD